MKWHSGEEWRSVGPTDRVKCDDDDDNNNNNNKRDASYSAGQH